MNPAPTYPNGFTLFEVIVIAVIVGVVFAATSPYLLGTKTKAVLTKDTETLRNALELAHQKALGAEGGTEHSVALDPQNSTYTTQPENQIAQLSSSISFFEPQSPRLITFSRLTGQSNGSHRIVLESKGFQTTITITEQGNITSTLPKKP